MAAHHLILTLFAVLCIQFSYSRRLRGPNVCFHYDIGRYCCDGFKETPTGFCTLNAFPNIPAEVSVKTTSSPLRFAGRHKQRIINLSPVDSNGRPSGIAYSHAAGTLNRDDRIDRIDRNPVRLNDDDFQKAVDMEAFRQALGVKYSDRKTTQHENTTPRIRHQKNKADNAYIYDQVHVGKLNDNRYMQVRKSDNGLYGDGRGGYFDRRDDSDSRAFRQGEIRKIPINMIATTRPTPVPEDFNRIIFRPGFVNINPIRPSSSGSRNVNIPATPSNSGRWNNEEGLSDNTGNVNIRPVEDDRNYAEQDSPPPNLIFSACPEGYTFSRSAAGESICYPLAGLTAEGTRQESALAPSRGDGATSCPTGHILRSSQFGDACVPFGWRPCDLDDPTCDHTKQPIVNPSDLGDCYSILQSGSEKIPCFNVGRPEVNDGAGGCQGGSCADCADDSCTSSRCTTGDCTGVECMSVDCGETTAECIGCNEGLGEVTACLNGGTVYDGYCACKRGFTGYRCEIDVDECSTGAHDCQHGCLNTVGSYRCVCPAGAVLSDDGLSCIFITCPKCLHGGTCDSTTNQCVCRSGFTGEFCENDINECSQVGLCSQICRNTFGSYVCLCRSGYTLLPDRHTCEDYRCSPSCVNGGACVKNRCQCPSGYSGIICQFENTL